MRSWGTLKVEARVELDTGHGRYLLLHNDGPGVLCLSEQAAALVPEWAISAGESTRIDTRTFVWSPGRARVRALEYHAGR